MSLSEDSKTSSLNQSQLPLSQHGAVLVTGGSGFVGKNLVKRLAASGETIVSMYHHRLPEPMANVYPVCSDMSSAELIAAPLRGVETIVHLAWDKTFQGPAGVNDWNFKDGKYPSNILILQNLIKACEKSGLKRFIFLSANGASRNASEPFLKEKYLAEFFVLNSKIPQKIIVRSNMICSGSEDRFVSAVKELMTKPGIYPVPEAKKKVAPVFIDDITFMLWDLISRPVEQEASIVEVCGKEEYKVDEVFKLISQKIGAQRKWQIRGFWAESLLPLFEKRPNKANPPQISVKMFLKNQPSVQKMSLPEDAKLLSSLPEQRVSFREFLAQI